MINGFVNISTEKGGDGEKQHLCVRGQCSQVQPTNFHCNFCLKFMPFDSLYYYIFHRIYDNYYFLFAHIVVPSQIFRRYFLSRLFPFCSQLLSAKKYYLAVFFYPHCCSYLARRKNLFVFDALNRLRSFELKNEYQLNFWRLAPPWSLPCIIEIEINCVVLIRKMILLYNCIAKISFDSRVANFEISFWY